MFILTHCCKSRRVGAATNVAKALKKVFTLHSSPPEKAARILKRKSKRQNIKYMSSIQDIRALEMRITNIVDDYIQEMYNEDDVLAIGRRCGKITVKADAKENIKVGKTTELYPLKDLVRQGDDGKPETDNDKISDIANSWIFLD